MRKALAAALILAGLAWPFVTHWLAMTRLLRVLSQDPRIWVLYSIFLSVLPAPALIYSGAILAFREQIPFPANAMAALGVTVALMAALSVVYYLSIGQVGFTARP